MRHQQLEPSGHKQAALHPLWDRRHGILNPHTWSDSERLEGQVKGLRPTMHLETLWTKHGRKRKEKAKEPRTRWQTDWRKQRAG